MNAQSKRAADSRRALAKDAWHKISGADQWVQTVHPYDLARYHYAHSRDGKRWDIYREVGIPYAGMPTPSPEHKSTVWGTARAALKEVRRLDKTVTAHIDLS